MLALAGALAVPAQTVFINEIHYDNSGTDSGEAVEIAGPAGTNVSGWKIVRYNGSVPSAGVVYTTPAASPAGSDTFASGTTIPNSTGTGYGFLTVNFAVDGLQNGTADGVALVDAANNVVQFLCYEGVMTAAGGPAAGMTCTDIGVSETGTTLVGHSLQLTGTGTTYTSFTWAAAQANTFGSLNTGQSFGGPSLPTLSINDVSLAEGNSGTVSFLFTVSLSAPAGAGGVSFNFATADGTATVANSDYQSTSGAGSIPSGQQSTTVTVLVNGDAFNEPNETFFVNITGVTGAGSGDLQGLGTITNDDAASCVPTHTIPQIQGSGAITPLAFGTTVTVRGVVTGLISNGYFIQDTSGDGNTATSDGLFVFTSSAPTVARGNDVCVTGPVTDFVSSTDNAARLTEITTPNTTSVLSTSVPLPAAVTLTTADPSSGGVFDQLEKYEGMRVTIPVATVIAPADGNVSEANATSSLDGVFYVTVQGAPRPFKDAAGIDQPANIVQTVPSVIDIPVTVPRPEGNPQRIFVDTNRQTGGPAPVDVSVGQTVTGLTGVLHYLDRTYALLPDPGTTLSVGGVAPAAPAISAPTSSQITVASFNMERLFPTGTNGVTATAYANRLNKLSLTIRNTLQSPDVIAVQEAAGTSLTDLAAKLNADSLPATPNYVGHIAPVTNDVGGIKVGFLVKGSRVSNVAIAQFGTAETFIDPRDNGVSLLNDRPPLVLSATAARSAAHLPFRFSVIVNHLRSNLGLDQPNLDSPSHLVSQGVYVRTKRLGQALHLAGLIQSRQTANPAEALVVLGDFNALNVSDGWADIMGTIQGTPAPPSNVVFSGPVAITPAPANTNVSPALTNLMNNLSASERYTYVFRGNAQVLDNVLVNPNALAQVASIQVGRGNADFSENFRNNAARPERISDHDMPVATFNLPANTIPAGITVLRGGLFFNRVTNAYSQTLTVRNTTAAPVAGPLVLTITGIADGWTWANRDGILAGAAYKAIPGASIPAGGTAAVSITWTRVGSTNLNYTTTVATAN